MPCLGVMICPFYVLFNRLVSLTLGFTTKSTLLVVPASVWVASLCYVGQPTHRSKEISQIFIFSSTKLHLSTEIVALIYCKFNIPTNDTLGQDLKIYSCEVKFKILIFSLYSLLIFDLQYG